MKQERYFLLKIDNHCLSLQGIVVFLQVGGLALMLKDTDCSGQGCWRSRWLQQTLKTGKQWSLRHWLTLPFMNDTTAACDAVWWLFPRSGTSFKIGINLLKSCFSSLTKFMQYSTSFMVISIVFTDFFFTRSRFHLKKPLSFLPFCSFL